MAMIFETQQMKKILLGDNSEIDNCEMVIKIEFRTWNHNNRPKSLSKQLIWIETKLFERRLSANQQWNVFLSVSAIMMSLYLALLDTFLP